LPPVKPATYATGGDIWEDTCLEQGRRDIREGKPDLSPCSTRRSTTILREGEDLKKTDRQGKKPKIPCNGAKKKRISLERWKNLKVGRTFITVLQKNDRRKKKKGRASGSNIQSAAEKARAVGMEFWWQIEEVKPVCTTRARKKVLRKGEEGSPSPTQQ